MLSVFNLSLSKRERRKRSQRQPELHDTCSANALALSFNCFPEASSRSANAYNAECKVIEDAREEHVIQ